MKGNCPYKVFIGSNDMKTCDLIPQKINDYFGHLGGVSECRKCEQMTDGGDFDE